LALKRLEVDGERELSARVDAGWPRIEHVRGQADRVGDADAKPNVELANNGNPDQCLVGDASSDASVCR
jgi:hypothetical protein